MRKKSIPTTKSTNSRLANDDLVRITGGGDLKFVTDAVAITTLSADAGSTGTSSGPPVSDPSSGGGM